VKKLADQQKFYTLPDFFFYLKGRFAGYLASIIVMIIMFGWVVLNFTAGAKLIEEYTPISYEFSVIIVGIIILLYLLMGGFNAVVKTDIIQTIGIFLLFILMLFLIITSTSTSTISARELISIPVFQIVSFFLAGFFIPMASAELWQRVYAIKDQKHFKRSLFLSSVFYLVIGCILLLIGLAVRTELPDIDPDTALIVGFSNLLPIGLSGLSVVIIYSAVSSSADTYLFTTSSTVTQDFLEKSYKLNQQQVYRTMRISMAILMALGIGVALILRDIVDATFLFVSLTMSLGFLTLVIWILPNINRYSVNISIVLCLLGVIIPAMIVGISTNLIIYAWASCLVGVFIGMVYNYRMNKVWIGNPPSSSPE
jgi:Na+/proline symporter